MVTSVQFKVDLVACLEEDLTVLAIVTCRYCNLSYDNA